MTSEQMAVLLRYGLKALSENPLSLITAVEVNTNNKNMIDFTTINGEIFSILVAKKVPKFPLKQRKEILRGQETLL